MVLILDAPKTVTRRLSKRIDRNRKNREPKSPRALNLLVTAGDVIRKTLVGYTRISEIDENKRLLGREFDGLLRQEEQIRAWAKANDYEVLAIYQDLDLSAFDPSVQRVGFECMIEDVERGVVMPQLVVAIDYDRLVRQYADHSLLRTLAEALKRPGAADEEQFGIVCVRGGVDSRTMGGRTVMDVTANAAQAESEKIQLRTGLQVLQSKTQGRAPEGAGRCYGHEKGWQTVVEPEAETIHWIVDQLMGGRSLALMARMLNERGIPTTRGKRWHVATLQQMLDSPRLCGYRFHEGVLYRSEHARDQIAPIIDVKQWLAMHRKIAVRSFERQPRRQEALLSGLLKCGKCGATACQRPMYSYRKRKDGSTTRYAYRGYACNYSNHGCGGPSVVADPVDAVVVGAALQAIELAEALGTLWGGDCADLHKAIDEITVEIDAIEAKMNEYASTAAELDWPAEMLATTTEAHTNQRKALRQRRERLLRDEAKATLLPRDVAKRIRTVWAEATERGDIAWQRELLRTVIKHVEIHPADQRLRNLPTLERVSRRIIIVWCLDGPVAGIDSTATTSSITSLDITTSANP